MSTQSMYAAWYEKQGDPQDVIQYSEMPVLEPSAGEVRVKVHASGVNPSDTKSRSISHGFDIGDWKPERVVQTADGSTVYLWTIPKEVPANLRTPAPTSSSQTPGERS